MERTSTTMRMTALGMVFSIAIVSNIFFLPEKAHAQTAAGGAAGSTAGAAAGGAAGGVAGCATLLATRSAATAAGTAAATAAGTAVSGATVLTGIPVHDVAGDAAANASIGTQLAVSTGQGTKDVVKCALDSLAWTVAKVAIQSITRSTVNWINTGFQGSPAFVTDLQQNLNVLSDTVAKNFFQQLNQATVDATGFNLTSPFQDQITNQLRQNYYKATGSLLGLNQYDLSGHSSDPSAFLHGNFNQGGFNAFFSANSNPANNPFGAYMIASNALWTQVDAAATNRRNEYLAGNGFSSWRGTCNAPQSQTSQGFCDPKDTAHNGGCSANAKCDANLNGGTCVIDQNSLTKTDACYGTPIKTPGSVIESQLENQLGTGIRQLELANSINEIVGALVGQLVNQVLGGGGLSGVSQPSAGGGSSYLDQATNPSQYSTQNSGITTGIAQIISNDLVTLAAYRDNWQKILDAATAAQQTCGVNQQNSVVIDQATAAVAKANTALQQETAISKSLQSVSASSATSPTQITTAFAQYQSYLAAPTTPSATDEAYAAAQSTDMSGSTGSSTPSLYTQMVNEKNTCTTQP